LGDKSELLQVETAAGAWAILLCTLVPLILVVTGIALQRTRADNRLWARVTVVSTLGTAVLLGAKAALVGYCLEDTSSPSGRSGDSFGFGLALSVLGAVLRELAAMVVYAVVVAPSGVWAIVLAVTGIVALRAQGRLRDDRKSGQGES
jgi:hypothetical protein